MTFGRSVLLVLPLLLGSLAACTTKGEAAPVTPPPGPTCPEGFSSAERGFCVEVAPADACPGGTRPAIGKTKCEPVGWTNCPSDFARDASGWGCIDPVVGPACGEGLRETLDGKCIPVGNCDAAFPPAGAIIVDDDFTQAQLDATHFRSIGEAIAAAPAGATVAIDRGTYIEDVRIPKDLKLVGRCAKDVIIEGAAVTTDPGIYTEVGAKSVEISGLTVVGHVGGISIYNGADAKISEVIVKGGKSFGIIVDSSTASIKRSKVVDTVVFDKRGGWGISAGSSDVTVDDVNVVGGTTAIYAGTTDATFTVNRLVASGQAPQSPNRSSGVYARGGRITMDRSLIHDIVGDGAVGAELPKGLVEVRNSVMRTIKVGGTLARGYGAVAFNGGEITLRDSAVLGAESVGILARDSGTIVSAYGTVVRGPPKSTAKPDENLIITSEGAGVGVQSVGKATLRLDGCVVIDAWGWGIYADTGGTLDLKHTHVDGVRPLEAARAPVLPFGIGIMVTGASGTLDDVSVARSTLTAVVAGRSGTLTGKGLYVRDVTATTPVGTGSGVTVGEGGTIDLEGSAIVNATTAGVVATSGSSSSLRLVNSTIHGTRLAPEGFGHGAVVANGASLTLEGTAVFENAAIGLVANGGRARLTSAVLARNPVAVQAQGGSFIVESTDAEDLGDNEVRISLDSRFVENGSRVGVGDVPLPANVLP